MPGLDLTRLFMRLTAGAGTRCLSLLSSSPSLGPATNSGKRRRNAGPACPCRLDISSSKEKRKGRAGPKFRERKEMEENKENLKFKK